MSNAPIPIMDSNAKYNAIDHEGLEVADKPNSAAPEVVPGSNPPLERKSSLNRPEVVSGGQQDPQYHAPAQEHADGHSAHSSQDLKAGFISADDKETSAETQNARGRRRYCGMRLGVLIGVIVVAVIVILGAVLGGVLGTQLKHNDS